MIGSVTENLRKLARQYSGQEIHNEDGTYTQVVDILLCAANAIEEQENKLTYGGKTKSAGGFLLRRGCLITIKSFCAIVERIL